MPLISFEILSLISLNTFTVSNSFYFSFIVHIQLFLLVNEYLNYDVPFLNL